MDWKLNEKDFNTLNGFDCDYHCTWDPTSEPIDDGDEDW